MSLGLGQVLSFVVSALPVLAYAGILVFLVVQRRRSPRRVTFAVIGIGLLIAQQVMTQVFTWIVFPRLTGGASSSVLASAVNGLFATLLFLAGFVLLFIAALTSEPAPRGGPHHPEAPRPGPYAAATGPYDPRPGGPFPSAGPPPPAGPQHGSGTGLPEPPGPPRGDVIEGP